MKNSQLITKAVCPVSLLFLIVSGCSSGPLSSSKSGEELSSVGPTVIDAKAEPQTIQLDRNLRPIQQSEIIADVKDFTSPITDVRVRFVRVPLEVKMQHISGTAWRAELTPEQLKTLAVSGQTMKYDAQIIAKNQDGQTAVSKSPITVAVQTPQLGSRTG